MYNLLVKLMVITTFIQLGLSVKDFEWNSNKTTAKNIEEAKRKVLKIDWKPISVFPEEAKKFR